MSTCPAGTAHVLRNAERQVDNAIATLEHLTHPDGNEMDDLIDRLEQIKREIKELAQ